MTPREQKLWELVNRRAARLEPELAQKILKAFREIAGSLTESELTKAIQSGDVDRIFNELLKQSDIDKAFQPAKDVLRDGIARSAKLFYSEVPQLSGAFNILSPSVITAIRSLEAPVFDTMSTDVRETVRAFIEQGLREGDGPRTIARGIRQVVGLGPSQYEQIANFRDALLGLNNRNVKDYTLRDKRFDKSIAKGNLSPEQVDKMVDAYTQRRVNQNAESVARDLALKSQKLAQRLSIQDAIQQGIYDESRMRKQRIGTDDGRERETHVAMNNEVRHLNEPYTNNEQYCGEIDFACRCVDRYFQAQGA